MKLKLKDDPKEWLKFTAVMAVLTGVVSLLLFRRNVLTTNALTFIGAVLVVALLACWARPGWFRGFYRAGMTATFRIGQVMGWVWLTLFFLFVLTPLGLLLRLLGKDLLALKRRNAPTYWRTTRTNNQFDRQF